MPPTEPLTTYVVAKRHHRTPILLRAALTHLCSTHSWATDFGKAWWLSDKYCIGKLSRKTRFVRCVNTLTGQSDLLEVCSEETLEEVQARYIEFNRHAPSYTWKALFDGAFRPLDMTLTLEENGVADDSEELAMLNMDPDEHIPVLHLYFNDDLTVA